MFVLLRKPSAAKIEAFIESQAKLDLTYNGIGTTATQPPTGYVVDRTRIRLDAGHAAFLAGQAALRAWEHFNLGWLTLCWPDTPLLPGQVVAVLGRACGLWSLNACRIVYTVDEQGPVERFGFAYGTLPEHIESGEERFSVEWNKADNSVWYDIVAFSRPNWLAARIGYPLVRRMQRQFRRDSAAAMRRAIGLGT